MHIHLAGSFDRHIDSFALDRVANDNDARDRSRVAVRVAEHVDSRGNRGAWIRIRSVAGDGVVRDQDVRKLLEDCVGVECDSREAVARQSIPDDDVAPVLRARRSGENADVGAFARE